MKIFNKERWMSDLPNEKKLVLLNIPGSHDSAAYYMNFFGGLYAKTQYHDIKTQLSIGVRKFDVRVAKYQPSCFQKKLSQEDIDDDRDLICVHGMCDCYSDRDKKKNLTYKEVLLEFKDFLKQNSDETIILETDSGRGNRYENIKRSLEISHKILGEMAVNYDKKLTLGEVRGKIVCTCFISEYDPNGNHRFNMNNIGGKGINDIHYNLIDKNYSTWKVDGQTKIEELAILFEIAKDFKTVEEDFEKNSKDYPLVYSISCTGEQKNKLFYPNPKAQKEIVIPFFMRYELKNGHYYGWIHIDFVDLNIATKIIDTNFT